MQDDVNRLIYTIIGLFIVVVVIWIGFVFVAGCGFDLDCEKGASIPNRTPIPTLIPADMPAIQANASVVKISCQITAVQLIGEWVSAGFPENEPFIFKDLNGQDCVGTYSNDISPLFVEANLWYPGAPACTTCHNSTLSEVTAAMDLSSYAGILAGSRRTSAQDQGNDILGAGQWDSSILYKQLFVDQLMPQGRPPDVPAEGPVVFAGSVQE